MIIEKAILADAEEILAVQKLAYISEAEIYNNYTIEPLVQSLEDVKKQFENHIFLKAVVGGAIVGSVRGLLVEGTCYIGKLIVHPNYQNMGIGKRLISELEFTSVSTRPLRYELFTGSKSEKNIHFYEKIGYVRFKIEMINANLSMVFLEKELLP